MKREAQDLEHEHNELNHILKNSTSNSKRIKFQHFSNTKKKRAKNNPNIHDSDELDYDEI